MYTFLDFVTQETKIWVEEYNKVKNIPILLSLFYSNLPEKEIVNFENFFITNAKKISNKSFKDSIIELAKEVDNLYSRYETTGENPVLVNIIGEEMWTMLKKITNFSFKKIDEICDDMDNFETSSVKILKAYYK